MLFGDHLKLGSTLTYQDPRGESNTRMEKIS